HSHITSLHSFPTRRSSDLLITHYKRFKDCQSLLHDFYSTSREGLQEKLGPVLFQFPPNMFFTEEMLFGIIEALDPSFLNVVEFRSEEHTSELQSRENLVCR